MMPHPSNAGWPLNQQWLPPGSIPSWGGTAGFPLLAHQQFVTSTTPLWDPNQWQQWNIPNQNWPQLQNTPPNFVFPQMPLALPLLQQEQPPIPTFPQNHLASLGTGAASDEEKIFDAQFSEWEKQFRAWKEENKNHPDKKALAEYEAQWESWRQQLLQKREQMKMQKQESCRNQPAVNLQNLVQSAALQKSSAQPLDRHPQNPDMSKSMSSDRPFDNRSAAHPPSQGSRDFDQRMVSFPQPADEDFRIPQRDQLRSSSEGIQPLFPGLKRSEISDSDAGNSSRKRLKTYAEDWGSDDTDSRFSRQSDPRDQHDPKISSTYSNLPPRQARSPDEISSNIPKTKPGGGLLEPVVRDYSNLPPMKESEPIVFDYYHLPGRFGQYSTPSDEPAIVFDYSHGRNIRQSHVEIPSENRSSGAHARPKVAEDPQTLKEFSRPIPVVPPPIPVAIPPAIVPPVPLPIIPTVPPPIPAPPKTAPTQLFPSAAAIESSNADAKALQVVRSIPSLEKSEASGGLPVEDTRSNVNLTGSGATATIPVETIKIEDILTSSGRQFRPAKLVVILRGLPGAGKSYIARLLKEKEVAMGGSAPRILSIDDYFLMDDGVPPVWSLDLEEQYRQNLLKSFKRNLDDGHFNFIIVDSLNLRGSDLLDLSVPARMRGFHVFLIDLGQSSRPGVTRNCSEADLNVMKSLWENGPVPLPYLDVQSLLHPTKEEVKNPEGSPEDVVTSTTAALDDDSQSSSNGSGLAVSRWEMMEQTEEKLDRLDGIVKRSSSKPDKPTSLEDWLQLPDDYDQRKSGLGKKRVRWADIEERNQQEKMRAVGFVVGQTDWSRMTDPTLGESALTQTKYI